MVRVLQYGVGVIGSEIAKLVLRRDGLELVGAVDADKNKVNRDLGDVLNLSKKLGINVTDGFKGVQSLNPDIILHSTSSHLKTITPQIEEILKSGIDVISTAEELAYPFVTQPEKSEEIDRIAKENKATVLGTGVNPGFIMDLLPLCLTAPCQKISNIKVTRIVNAAKRRKPLQEKIGVALAKEEFEEKIASGGGHIGLVESVALIAKGLNWDLDDIKETIEPVITKCRIDKSSLQVKRGQVIGLKQVAKAIANGEEIITLDLRMYLGAPARDQIIISGIPDLKVSFEGGLHGDLATPAVVVNSIPQVSKAPPGLLTVLDLPVTSTWAKL